MKIDDIITAISKEYKEVYLHSEIIPEAYCENIENVKAIVLGCDPSNPRKETFNKAFGLDINMKYFGNIKNNLETIGLDKSNVYIDNLCKNYFTVETSKNKYWVEIADKYWIPYLKDELDKLFSKTVPVFATADILLKALCYKGCYNTKNNDLYYKECKYIEPNQNKLGRKIIPLFRNGNYQLKKWLNYVNFVKKEILK